MYKLTKKGKYMMNDVNIKKFVESLHKSYSNDENKFNWKQIVKVFKTSKFDNKSEVYNWVKAQKTGRGSYIIPLSSVSSSVTNNVVKVDTVKSCHSDYELILIKMCLNKKKVKFDLISEKFPIKKQLGFLKFGIFDRIFSA